MFLEHLTLNALMFMYDITSNMHKSDYFFVISNTLKVTCITQSNYIFDVTGNIFFFFF